MKKTLLSVMLLAGLTAKVNAQISILGPTFIKNYTPSTTHGDFVDDPLSNSGRIWTFPSYAGQTTIAEYSSMANFIANVTATTYVMPVGYMGTGHVVYGGNVYFNKFNTGNIVKYNLATQAVVLDVPLAGAGFMNAYAYQWGGYSDIDFAVDENGLYVIYANAANAGNIIISKLNPATLLPTNTYSTATTKSCGNSFMVQGTNYSIGSYSNLNTTLSYKYNTLNATGAAIAIPFTNGSSYMTSASYNPTTKVIFAWNNSMCYSYTVVSTNSINASVSNTAICAGSTVNVTFTAAGSYTAPNTFTAQLSDAAGSFTNAPTNIGTLVGIASGVITATIPLGTPAGAAYRIRVSSNTPGIIGNDNGGNITIAGSPTVNVAATGTLVCAGASATLTASGAASYSWSNGPATATSVVSPTANTIYTVVGTNTVGCFNTNTIAINTTAGPVVAIAGTSSICAGGTVNLTASGANTYSWSNGAATATIAATPSANVTYTVVGTSSVTGCSSSTTQAVAVNALPSVSVTGGGTICANQSTVLTASGANTYSWNTGATTSSISVSPTVSATYTAIGTSSAGCSNSLTVSVVVDPCTGIQTSNLKAESLNVYPNPTTGEFTVELNNGSNKTIEISDLTGRIVLSVSGSKDKMNINMTSLSNGVYYVKVTSNKTVEVIKMIKQ